MKSTLKVLLWILGVVVVLIVAAVVILPMVIDPNDYRDEIADAVRDQTGRDLTIEGDLELSVFPWLGVSIGRTSLSNDPGFGDTPMLVVEDASVGVRLGALLSRRLEVSEVRLDGLRLNLVRRADGSNWDSLVSETEEPAAPATEEGAALDLQEIGGVRITDAQISIIDDVEKLKLNSELETLAVGAVALRGEDVDVDGVEISGAKLDYAGAEGNVTFALEQLKTGRLAGGAETATVDGLDLSNVIVEYASGPDSYRIDIKGLNTGNIVADPDAPQIDGLKLDGAQFRIAGADADPVEGTIESFEIESLVPGQPSAIKGRVLARVGEPALDMTLDLDGQATLDGQKFSLAGLKADAALAGETIPGGEQSMKMRFGSVELDNEAQTFAVKRVKLKFAGLDLTLRANGKQLDAEPDIRGQLELAEFSPRGMMQSLGMEAPVTADPEVLTRAALSSNFRLAGGRVSLPNLVATLDDTRLEGKFSAAEGQPQVVRATLVVDAIDLDRYLPPESDEEAVEEETVSAEINTEDLRGQDIEAGLTIGTVKVSGITMTEVETKAVIRKGKLTIAPLGAKLYDGEVSGRVVLDGSGDVPKLRLNQSLKTVQLSPLFKDLADVERLAGAANGNIKLNTTGRNSDQMLSALNGEMRFRINDGALRGINITHSVQTALALLELKSPPPKTEDDTPFRQLKVTATVEDGVMRSDDLEAKLPTLAITGAGSVDLAKQTVDYRLVAAVPQNQASKQAGLGNLAGKSVPITIKGSLDDPSIKPDVSAAVQEKAKSMILDQLGLGKDKEEGEQDGSERDLKDEAEEKLKKLFGK